MCGPSSPAFCHLISRQARPPLTVIGVIQAAPGNGSSRLEFAARRFRGKFRGHLSERDLRLGTVHERSDNCEAAYAKEQTQTYKGLGEYNRQVESAVCR
jgi:hypothetical protein